MGETNLKGSLRSWRVVSILHQDSIKVRRWMTQLQSVQARPLRPAHTALPCHCQDDPAGMFDSDLHLGPSVSPCWSSITIS
ncbi:hypothetical protein RRG08_044847 [Elysia crispata]|uniref:Uncharacterized protein n=1 Tax=Elysia crispata TaxID=231223 RepID=A0AAE1A442_9GAST|nr:hypothetical protein RRG08_044847 [Elysia crispata]